MTRRPHLRERQLRESVPRLRPRPPSNRQSSATSCARAGRGTAELQDFDEGPGAPQGYLHKLEAGRVENPSPRVLQRLSEALDLPYRRLMELADYLVPTDEHTGASRLKEPTMAIQAQPDVPTNGELMRVLRSVLDQLTELNRGQQELTEALKRLAGAA